MKPKISVLMTVYNGENFIEKTMESILNQTFKDFELIIIDDGSTDSTKKIIMNFKDKRIRYFYYGKNKGYENLHNVINFGINKCKGKYIARTDSDDISHRNRLEVQYNYLEKNKDIFMVGSSAEVIDKDGKKIGVMKKKPWPSWIMKLIVGFNNPFIHSSIMFRNEGLKYLSHVEHYFFVQATILRKKLKNLNRTLIKYRINPSGLISKSGTLEGNKYKEFYRK